MNNFHDKFINFNSNIILTNSKKEKIIKSRDAVKDKIKTYFTDTLKFKQPKFYMQGSFVINTVINPIDNEEVDLDYGVYLQHLPDDQDKWITPKKAHELILDSLENHTKDGCESKTSCVRVVYKNFYHLDLPIYIMHKEKAYLAQTKENKWINSDSKEFKDWFYEKSNGNEQLNRLIRYFKAWRDFNNKDFTSIELTILMVNNYVKSEKDDISLKKTLNKIIENMEFSKKVEKPVSPFEDLWESLSNNKKNKKIETLENFYDDLLTALNNESYSKGYLILRELFGERMPKLKNDEEKDLKVSIVESGAKPWKI